MSAVLKTFRTRHAFYAEVIDSDNLVGAIWLANDPENPIAKEGYLHEAFIDVDKYDDFDFETSGDLPGYVVVTFYRMIGKVRHRQRCVLYGPAGYMGEYPTASAAFEAAAIHKASLEVAPKY
ncbi:hypothetical protein [Rhizobium sullae]|uniref:Uncharacterized protein n=1 Tax=Rhizobium sullae TaxID=50338 RepID=A0A4R3PYX2_RHISU|nr:hypothetical protein [Rhizobium sullae]TCU13751.1 hypothetical protein EV132_111184 [Rhizobium sullae]